MRSTRRAMSATMAGLFVIAGLFAGFGGELGTSAHSTTVLSADDMPWGVVKPGAPPAGMSGDMPWG